MSEREVRTETVEYTVEGARMVSHLAVAAGVDGRRPGVLVLPEWWGLDDYIRGRAGMLAGLGYTALAVDMYGDGATAASPEQAGKLMNAVLGDMSTGTARLRKALETLKARPGVDPARTAAIGYCFGGAMALHMARTGMDVGGVVSFHGSLGSFHEPAAGEIKAKVLVCHGAADQFIPQADIDAFKEQMSRAGASYRFVAYEGALHGFTSRDADENGKKFGLPLAYDERADSASWAQMRALFDEIF